MTLETFYEQFELLADAPNAVQKLREMVLQLAVRGKLVEQERSDEPARVFLSSIPPSKPNGELHMIRESKKPFEVPQTWEWVRFADVAEFRAGKTPSRKDSRFWADGVYPWVSIADMKHGKTLYETKEQVSEIAESEVFRGAISPGGTLLMSFKLTIGKMSVLDVDAFHNEAIISIYPHHEVLRDYFFRCLNGFDLSAGNKDAIKGKTLNRQSLSSIVLAVPPENEITRILSKYDELMALCDDLETQQQTRAEARSRLNTVALGRLSSATDEASFKQAWARVGSAFDTLYRTPETIIDLRKTILQLAVQGKLVRQDPDDEPAEKLLEKIRNQKKRLKASGNSDVTKEMAPLSQTEEVFGAPSGWQWVRFTDVLLTLKTGPFGSSLHKADYVVGGIPVINPASMKGGGIRPIAEMAVNEETHKRLAAFTLQEGDIVMARRGDLGRCSLVTQSEAGWLCGTGSLILRFTDQIFQNYIAMLLGSVRSRAYLMGSSVGSTMNNLNQRILLNMPIVLPPLSEQKRIVAKVDELMALVDELEAGLLQARGDSERLLGAVIQSLLSSETKQVVEA